MWGCYSPRSTLIALRMGRGGRGGVSVVAVVVSVPTWSSAFIAPRNLKLPVFCRHSAWISTHRRMFS